MSDFTYENDVSTMSVTRSLAMSSAPAGGLVCIGDWDDDYIAFGQNGLRRKRCDKMSACDNRCKGKPGSLQLYLCRNDQSVPCRGSVEKRNIFGKRGTPGSRSGVLSETDDQIVYSK